MRTSLLVVLVAVLCPVSGSAQTRSPSGSCEQLGGQMVRADGDVPAYCRVAGSTRAVNSDVKFEVWLPAAQWTGDIMPAGSSFWGGPLPLARMKEIVRTGAVTVGTDLGIEGFTGPSFVLSQPGKLENLKMEPLHVVVARARALATAFYPPGPTFSVMNECGGGGSRDVLALVQRFPEDLDAAVAVNFTNYGTRHGVSQMWLYDATHRSPEALLPVSKLPMLHQAVLDACDMNDGVKDRIIENPKTCRFDPVVLQCKAGDNATCLTQGQVAAVRRMYETPRHERTGEPIYGPMEKGSELGWGDMIGSNEPYRYSLAYYRNLIFKDPTWTYDKQRPNFGTDIDRSESAANVAINHTNPDLRGFVKRGGKLLLVGGWKDDLPPQNVVSYYESVVKTMGDGVRDSVRLFMVPGMHHCFGGTYPGAYKVDFDPVQAVRQWKRTGQAPDQIVVDTSGEGWPARKRLVCAYPKVSAYKGRGDVGDPANFSCRMP